MALKANKWACVASQRIRVKRPRQDETITGNHQLGLASPLQYAAIQSDKTKKPSKKGDGAGCKSQRLRIPRGQGEEFFLDILFHRMSEIARYASLCRTDALVSSDSLTTTQEKQ